MTTSGEFSDTYAENADFWVKIIREGLDRYRTELTDAKVVEAVGDCNGLDVLDGGCGEGYMSRLLAERGARAVGVDTSSALIEAAAAHEDARRLDIRFVVGSLETIPEPSDSFDVVVCNHVLSDVREPRVALAEIARVLRPGGRLVALMLHPCFYTAHAERDSTGTIPVATYFSERKIDQQFMVAGIESPDEVHMNFRPLEFYASAILSAGFSITGLSEPHPDTDRLIHDDWWRANFRKPLFLLVTAHKNSDAGSGERIKSG